MERLKQVVGSSHSLLSSDLLDQEWPAHVAFGTTRECNRLTVINPNKLLSLKKCGDRARLDDVFFAAEFHA
jgi:hypothetical protein